MHILAFLFLIGWLWVTVSDSLYRRRKLAEFHRAIREKAAARELKWDRAKAFVALWRERSVQNGRAHCWNDEIAEDKAIELQDMAEHMWPLFGGSYCSDGFVRLDLPNEQDQAALSACAA
jgi:hypothetical protein